MSPNKISAFLQREWIPLLIYAATFLTFLPILHWLTGRTLAEEQLRHAFIVLGMAGVFLVVDQRISLRLNWDFGPPAIGLLAAAYAGAVLTWITGWAFVAFPSLILALASFLLYLLGRCMARVVGAFLGAFGAYTALAIFLPALDWPLRGIAAQGSGWFLGLLGKEIDLRLLSNEEGPQLLLFANDHPFLVAPECNGFGVLTASLLLSMLLVLYRPLPFFDKLLLVFTAGICGILFNFIRIIIIVVLAPIVGLDNYHLMHEIVGTITYYTCLVFIWWLIQGFRLPTDAKPASVPTTA